MRLVQFILFLCTIFLFVSTSLSAVAYSPNAEDPAKPGYCKVGDDDKSAFYLKPGQSRRHPKLCMKVECKKENDQFRLSYIGCGAMDIASKKNNHCGFIPGDLSKPFPHCCTDFIC